MRGPRTGQAPQTLVIGAGPAGLTAAYELVKRGRRRSTVLEGDAMVGGISRTVEREGWRFDIGGHRFFTKVPEVEELWHEILPDEDFLLRPRMSRIFYDGKLLRLPAEGRATRCATSGSSRPSAAWRPTPGPGSARRRTRRHFEGWVVARFGWRLYRHFFKTYTEKVWGVPASRARRPTGPRSGSRTCRCRARCVNALHAQAQPEGDHLA